MSKRRAIVTPEIGDGLQVRFREDAIAGAGCGSGASVSSRRSIRPVLGIAVDVEFQKVARRIAQTSAMGSRLHPKNAPPYRSNPSTKAWMNRTGLYDPTSSSTACGSDGSSTSSNPAM